MSNKRRILIVDDSPVVRKTEELLLRRLGEFEVVTACNGLEGVETARKERPDLILMDYIMPEMNGFEACAEIKNDPSTKDIPVIIISTRGEAENVDTGMGAGADEYLTKPIDGPSLRKTIRSFLGTE